jgi:hypothetical protein
MRGCSWWIQHVLLLFIIHSPASSRAAWNATDDEAPTRIKQRRKLQRITVIGGTGTPPEDAYPLQKCQGDCDKDEDVSKEGDHE